MHVLLNNSAGLTSKGAVESFEVAGAEGVFYPAAAEVVGDTLTVSSPAVPAPRYVRYAWANYPPPDHAPNLYNAAGLPAAPFTTYSVP